MFLLYQTILTVIFIISPILVIYRININKEHKKRYREKFGLPSRQRVKGKLIWFHGASVGEIFSIIPLIENYEKNKSIHQILITSSTLSSSKILKNFNFKKTIHQFYPIDHIFITRKFLNYWKPNSAIFIESEIWPCMFKELKKRKVPLILLNARITKKTFRKWIKIKYFSREIFNKITIAFPQNLETKLFLKELKTNKIKTIGNLKFTENDDKRYNDINPKLKSQFKSKKIWVASSTHPSEEIFCAQAHIYLKKKFKNLLTIIIPRHIHRSKRIISELENFNLKIVKHSSNIKKLNNTDIYLVNTFGETKKFHKIGCSVFLGGSVINRGGQNPLEAARYGARILHGPNIDNFKEVYKTLEKLKISKKISTPAELSSLINFKKNKIIGAKIKKIGVRILKETVNEIDKVINNEYKKT